MVRSKNTSSSSSRHHHHHHHRHHDDRHKHRTSKDVKPKRRNRPGKVTEREIKYYQASTFLLLRKTPFYRLVREICLELFPQFNYRFQEAALMALQESVEAYAVNLFGQSSMVAINSKRKTVMARDMQLVCYIRQTSD